MAATNIRIGAGHDVHFINFLFAIGPDSYRDSGLKILYRAMHLNLNYLFVYFTFVKAEISLIAQPMRKR